MILIHIENIYKQTTNSQLKHNKTPFLNTNYNNIQKHKNK